jgi:NAD-dependent deacetylase
MDPATDRDRVARLLLQSRSAVSFTGAGLSKASGIPTYRDTGGLWTEPGNVKYSSPAALHEDPEGFAEFWRRRRQELARAEPNAAHRALARMETLLAELRHVTQNVDGLLTRAGCSEVHELHGSLARQRCSRCDAQDLEPLGRCPRCGAPARPDVVMFGELLPRETFEAALRAVRRCEVCLVVGTSAVVQPAAGLIERAAAGGARVVVVDVEPTAADPLADIVLRGPAETILPQLADSIARQREAA